MKTKEVNTSTLVNWVQVNADGTNSYLGRKAHQFLVNSNLQEILEKYHEMELHPNSCHLHIYDLSDINNPYLVATQSNSLSAESYMNEDRVMIIHEKTALHNYKKN